jgi:hypothetical protein
VTCLNSASVTNLPSKASATSESVVKARQSDTRPHTRGNVDGGSRKDSDDDKTTLGALSPITARCRCFADALDCFDGRQRSCPGQGVLKNLSESERCFESGLGASEGDVGSANPHAEGLMSPDSKKAI